MCDRAMKHANVCYANLRHWMNQKGAIQFDYYCPYNSNTCRCRVCVHVDKGGNDIFGGDWEVLKVGIAETMAGILAVLNKCFKYDSHGLKRMTSKQSVFYTKWSIPNVTSGFLEYPPGPCDVVYDDPSFVVSALRMFCLGDYHEPDQLADCVINMQCACRWHLLVAHSGCPSLEGVTQERVHDFKNTAACVAYCVHDAVSDRLFHSNSGEIVLDYYTLERIEASFPFARGLHITGFKNCVACGSADSVPVPLFPVDYHHALFSIKTSSQLSQRVDLCRWCGIEFMKFRPVDRVSWFTTKQVAAVFKHRIGRISTRIRDAVLSYGHRICSVLLLPKDLGVARPSEIKFDIENDLVHLGDPKDADKYWFAKSTTKRSVTRALYGSIETSGIATVASMAWSWCSAEKGRLFTPEMQSLGVNPPLNSIPYSEPHLENCWEFEEDKPGFKFMSNQFYFEGLPPITSLTNPEWFLARAWYGYRDRGYFAKKPMEIPLIFFPTENSFFVIPSMVKTIGELLGGVAHALGVSLVCGSFADISLPEAGYFTHETSQAPELAMSARLCMTVAFSKCTRGCGAWRCANEDICGKHQLSHFAFMPNMRVGYVYWI